MMIVRLLLVALLVFVVVTIAAFVYLDWWVALIVSALLVVAFAAGARFAIRSFIGKIHKTMIAAFAAKAVVLRDAAAEVHSVEAAPVPPPRADDDDDDDDDELEDEEEDEDQSPRELAYYRVDVTIKPRPNPQAAMQFWDVDDLCVVDVNARPLKLDIPDDDNDYDPGEGFHFHTVQVMQDGQWKGDEDGKHQGEQRLSLLVGVPPELRELKFRYYTEQFGRVVLPPPYPRDAGGGAAGQQPQLA